MQLFRATGVVAVKIGGILALLPLLLGVVTLPAHADSSPFPSGSVLIEMYLNSNSPVRDSNGSPTGGGCMLGGYDNVPHGGQVVVLDSSKSFTANGNTYIYVAFGDSCDYPQLDYTSRSIGWVDAADFNSTNAVKPPSDNATYRDCWTPNNCQDTPYSGGSLQSKDNVLYAWWNGSAWDPHWWHVKDSKGNDAAVYGRDWNADSCSFLGC